MGQNYFNTLPLRLQLQQLGKCRFMDSAEFSAGCEFAKGKKIVIVGCGAQGPVELQNAAGGLGSPQVLSSFPPILSPETWHSKQIY